MPGVTYPESLMNAGKALFAQLMGVLPWKSFHRVVDQSNGDRYVKSMTHGLICSFGVAVL